MDWSNVYVTRAVLLFTAMIAVLFALAGFNSNSADVLIIFLVIVSLVSLSVGIMGKMWLRGL